MFFSQRLFMFHCCCSLCSLPAEGSTSEKSDLCVCVCDRQKLVLHASKARSLFTEECAMKYRLFISKSEEWMRWTLHTHRQEVGLMSLLLGDVCVDACSCLCLQEGSSCEEAAARPVRSADQHREGGDDAAGESHQGELHLHLHRTWSHDHEGPLTWEQLHITWSCLR